MQKGATIVFGNPIKFEKLIPRPSRNEKNDEDELSAGIGSLHVKHS